MLLTDTVRGWCSTCYRCYRCAAGMLLPLTLLLPWTDLIWSSGPILGNIEQLLLFQCETSMRLKCCVSCIRVLLMATSVILKTDKLGNDVQDSWCLYREWSVLLKHQFTDSANSPLSDVEENRHRVPGNSTADDPDATVTDGSFPRSTVLDDPAHVHHVRCRQHD